VILTLHNVLVEFWAYFNAHVQKWQFGNFWFEILYILLGSVILLDVMFLFVLICLYACLFVCLFFSFFRRVNNIFWNCHWIQQCWIHVGLKQDILPGWKSFKYVLASRGIYTILTLEQMLLEKIGGRFFCDRRGKLNSFAFLICNIFLPEVYVFSDA